MESVQYDKKVYHKSCFKCKECQRTLTLSGIAQFSGFLYCKNCFKRIFKTRGKYDDFGEHTHAKTPNCAKAKAAEPAKAAEKAAEPAKKPEKIEAKKTKDIEDSNISALGSKADLDARAAAAATEDAWKDAGKKVGLQIWRIEKFQVVAWPEDKYGTFFDGDSYIVLRTYRKPEDEKLSFDLHFWLGADSSQDEKGTAAYKTVELDDHLGQTPVQYRQVMGWESQEFLNLFDGTITLLKGGVESGFNKVEPEKYEPRLLHCKGKKNVRVTQVELSIKSLNHGDCFVLDNGLTIYQFNGKTSGVMERNKARDIRLGLVDERNGRPKCEVVDGADDNEDFWALLGVDATPAEDDIAAATPDDEVPKFERKAYEISDDSGKLVCKLMGSGDEINRQMFGSTDVYLLDVGHQVFVFVGIDASKLERSSGMRHATMYLEENKRPMHTPIVRVLEGGATIAFEKAFAA